MKIFKRKLVKQNNGHYEWLSVEVKEKDIEIKQVIWRDFTNDYEEEIATTDKSVYEGSQ